MSDDIRKVIYLDEIQSGGGESEEEEQRQSESRKSKYLSESELKNKLESYKGRIPSIVIRDLYDLLRGRRVTEEQVERIVQNVEQKLRDRIDIDVADLYSKIDRLEKLMEKLARGELVQQKSEGNGSVEQDAKVDGASVGEQEAGQQSGSAMEEDVAEVRGFEDLVSGGFGGEIVRAGEKAAVEKAPVHAHPAIPFASDSVHLDRIPANTKSMMFLLKWIEYMIERVGYSGLEDVLDYYVDIGWISESVMFDILRYAKGIRLYHESSDWRPVGYMNVQDHIMSLLFIEALKTGRMNKEILHEVERQIYRIKKGVSEINGL
ncbi:FlaD/FlaE family flagellar protein [Geoglobus sp.]